MHKQDYLLSHNYEWQVLLYSCICLDDHFITEKPIIVKSILMKCIINYLGICK